MRGRVLKGFYHIWAWRQSWSSDPDAANKLSFPLPKEAPHKFGFDWLTGFGEEDVGNCGHRSMPDHGYTISSPVSLRLSELKTSL